MTTGEQNERVYITADIARDADRYHRHPNRCPSVAKLELNEISVGVAGNNKCTLCANCKQIDKQSEGGSGPTHGLARKLDQMNVSDVLGRRKA